MFSCSAFVHVPPLLGGRKTKGGPVSVGCFRGSFCPDVEPGVPFASSGRALSARWLAPRVAYTQAGARARRRRFRSRRHRNRRGEVAAHTFLLGSYRFKAEDHA